MSADVAPLEVPPCPGCGARNWRVPTAVEISVRVTPVGIDQVEVAEAFTMDGEGDPRCNSCGELLLDWGLRSEDDDAWQAHHDERRPAWDALVREVTPSLELPHPSTWSLRPPTLQEVT